MKYLRKCLIGLGVLALVAAILLWFLPARWVLPRIEPQLHGLHFQQVQGTLWAGHGTVIGADGEALGQLRWQLSRRALFGQQQLQLDFQGPQLSFSGEMRRLPDNRVEWRAVQVQGDLLALDAYVSSPLGKPRGELHVSVDHALMQAGWPLQLQASAQWQHAAMHTQDGDIALGELQWQAQAHEGVIQAQLHDDGHGPLHVEGTLQLSPLGWRLDAMLRSRQIDPILQRWLTRLGTSAADGSVHIQRHGGLAGDMSTPAPH